LISPVIVGTAKLENAMPRAGSKRSTALTRPKQATWKMSSKGSSGALAARGEAACQR
jgi:hypothetical protein